MSSHTIQHLRDKVAHLQSLLAKKNTEIEELQKQKAALNAELLKAKGVANANAS